MSAINFATTNQTWRQLFGNGTSYVVPRFQRDYSWTEEEWDDLWQDVQATMAPNGEPAHYMGYLVLQSHDQKSFDVVDGQQRLTTLSLLALAVLKVLDDLVVAGIDANDNKRRIEQLRSTYVGYLDPVTLVSRNKLTLNRNSDSYYRDYVVPLRKLPVRRLHSSEHGLRKAFQWLYTKIAQYVGSTNDGQKIAGFLDVLSDRLFFTVITVSDELNAFKVFETLNARGVRLSPTDLLKNYLFSVVQRENPHDREIESLEDRWIKMVGQLGGESFPGFLRAHWNSRNQFTRETDLFKVIRASTKDKSYVFTRIREMEEDIDTFAALQNPEDAIWVGDQRRLVRELRLFSVRQPTPLILAAARAFDAAGLSAILRASMIISVRYNVIGGLAPAEQERVYNRVAQAVATRKLSTSAETIRALAPIYISDKSFREAFTERVLDTTNGRNKSVVRHILFRIEEHVTNRAFDTESAQITLEHILPENPGDQWPQFDDRSHRDGLYRLGNFALLQAAPNRKIGNIGFAEKQPTYAKSEFEITKRIAVDNAEWTIDRIAARQRWMADQATSIWRIDQLS
ncbi:MAG: DUF262 domain-containing protein [Hyphomicrobium sp.]